MTTITVKDGTTIYYKDWGEGPVVTFSHGWPLNSDAWDGQMLFLAQNGFRVVAHDRAEACDVPVRWSCRTGVCHTCMTGLIGGSIAYQPEPLERPAPGNVLICCSQPSVNVTIDL